MKKLNLLALLGGLIVLAGCSFSRNQKPSDTPVTTGGQLDESGSLNNDDLNQQTPTLSAWSLQSTGYTVTQLTGNAIPSTYSGNNDVYTITENSTNRWTYLIVSPLSWNDFINQRNFNIFQDHNSDMTGSLANTSFATKSANSINWYMVQVPVDRVLLVTEDSGTLYVLDFDDPSGLNNMMMSDDIDTLISAISLQ